MIGWSLRFSSTLRVLACGAKLATTSSRNSPSSVGIDCELSPFPHAIDPRLNTPLGLIHVCLNMDEIVRFIACELVASKAKATAVALAGCRKSFEVPVLDALWGTQEHLLPLLKSLPGDVWNEGGYTVSTQQRIFPSLNYFVWKSLKRFPTTPEWARFRRYARSMRKLKQPRPLDNLPLEALSVLQLCAVNEPLFPNLKTLQFWPVTGELIPFIPLFLSPRTTDINITFAESSDLPKAMVASVVATFPKLCPNLQRISLESLPRNPMIAAAISRMLLANDRNSLQSLKVDSPLTEDAHKMIHRLPNLHELSVIVERVTSFPPLVLPNLAELDIKYDGDWLQIFRGATFGKLESATFYPGPEQIGGLLEAFGSAILAGSAQNTLSWFSVHTVCSWNPTYSSLLPFT